MPATCPAARIWAADQMSQPCARRKAKNRPRVDFRTRKGINQDAHRRNGLTRAYNHQIETPGPASAVENRRNGDAAKAQQAYRSTPFVAGPEGKRSSASSQGPADAA